jgi:NAD(P)-dependent dehydrogenase (short-subunit alcohol dehydrogenase family)
MKIALITGGSRGIGKATVKEFLDSGYKVITTSTTGKVPTRDKNLSAYKFRLGNSSDIKRLIKGLSDSKVKIDVLINNACMADKEVDCITVGGLKQSLGTNLVGTIDLTLKLISFLNNNGVIVNISSEFGSLSDDWGYRVPAYRITKVALNMFTRSFYKDKEIRSKNIKVYSFDPGWVKTDMGGPGAEREPEEPAKELLRLVGSNKPSGLFYRGLKARAW